MATTNIQDSVYKAVDVIVKKRIDDLHLDKTIECVIENCIDLESGKYRVKYGTGFFDAYSVNGEAYFPNTPVYILVPENDFNNKKTIIGKVNSGLKINIEEDDSSLYTDYSIIGKNILNLPNNEYFKICSSSSSPVNYQQILYDKNSSINKITLNEDALKVYLQETQGFRFSGEFKTNAKTKTGSEDFGLTFVFTQKNANITYASMTDRWEKEAGNTAAIIDNEEKTLLDYAEEVNNIFSSTEQNIFQIQKELLNIVSSLQLFKTGINSTNNNELELTDLYINLLIELSSYTVNTNNNSITKQDLIDQYNTWFTGTSYGYERKTVTYSLNTSVMTGNPYHYSKDSFQYFFVDIDPESFISLDQIIFYSNFERDNSNQEYDLWVKNIAIECIKYVNNTNGDYRLSLKYSDTYFDESASDKTSITITAKLMYQDKNNVTQYARFLWFKKNSNIKSDNIKYNNYGGEGWEHLTDNLNTALYDRSPELTLYAEDNKVYRNQYKVIAMYETSLPIEQEFIIYNEKHNHNIELVSDSGLYFGINDDITEKTIICQIDGKNEPPSNDYLFQWFIDDIEIKTEEELAQLIVEIENEQDVNKKNKQQNQYNILQHIIWEKDSNIIKINAKIMSESLIKTGQIILKCDIFVLDENDVANDFDTIQVILKNKAGIPIYLKDYYIEIENGNQVFQYNEAGISPASSRYEDPIVPKQLSCKLYDPAGGYVDRLNYYEISWEIPITNTLINVDNSLLQMGANGTKNKIIGDVCNFTIADEYNYNAINNQIICEIKVPDKDAEDGIAVYRQSTNFFFGKVGEDGTNGTDVIAKISPININNILTKEVLTLNIDKTNENEVVKTWNNGVTSDQNAILQLELFRKNELIDPNEYKRKSWSILNNNKTSKYWRTFSSIGEDSIPRTALTFDETKSPNGYTNYIVKGQASLAIDNDDLSEPNYSTYFGFYPICTITKYADVPYKIGIDKNRTLRHVMYNSDGRLPQYDRNLGVGLTFTNINDQSKNLGDEYSRTIIWEPHGGIIQGEYIENNPSFSIGRTQSWVPSIEGELEEKIESLQADKENILENTIQQQENNCINNIKETLNSIKIDIQQQKENNLAELTRLNNKVVDLWNEFKSEQETNYNNAWNLLNQKLIDSIKIEDYLYQGNTKYIFSDDRNFKKNLDEYIRYNLIVDGIKRGILQELPEQEPIFKTSILLDLSLKLPTEGLDKNIKTNIEDSFNNLIMAVVFGYIADLIIFDNKTENNQNIFDLIVELQENQTELNKQLEEYNQIQLIDIEGEEDSEGNNGRQEKIKAVLFNNDIINNEDGFSEALSDIILKQKDIYLKEIETKTEEYDFQINYLQNNLEINADPTFCAVIPNESYTGEFTNQYVKASVYKNSENENLELEYEIIVPFHMYLNAYGLGLLNGWDGNGLEINDEGGYILAPQMGAGKKDENNAFTGLLVGTRKEYNEENQPSEMVGLFGYSKGLQSILLDSSTGSATFGLPEQDGELSDGRIELIPGGISSISQWKIDSRSLYNIIPTQKLLELTEDKHITEEPKNENLLGPRYEDAPQYAHGSIPHDKQGILLSALPSYVSFKGRQLTYQDHINEKINFLNSNTTAREGDSFELQIDPNDSKFFTLYEHSFRLNYGEAICDQWKNFKTIYNLTADEIREFFIGENTDYIINDYTVQDNDYLICQSYYTTDGRKLRVLSLLKFDNKERWELINSTIDKDNFETEEYVVGELQYYNDWSYSYSDSVWSFICFTDSSQSIEIIDFTENESRNGLTALSIDKDLIQNKIWRRYRKAGIDATGKFTAESLGVGSLGMGLGDIKAFDNMSTFVGTSLETDTTPIIQFFIDKYNVEQSDTGPAYISSSKIIGEDEGKRPIRIYAGAKPKNIQNYESIFGIDSYKSGIFVGENAERNPENKITKIELWQTTSNDNNITLSALGSTNDYQSILTLSSNNAGSLIHTGAWTNTINGEWINWAKDEFRLHITKGVRITGNNNKVRIDSGADNTGDNLAIKYAPDTNSANDNLIILGANGKISTRSTFHVIGGDVESSNGVLTKGVTIDAPHSMGSDGGQGILLRTWGQATNAISGSINGDMFTPGAATLWLKPTIGTGTTDCPQFILRAGGVKNGDITTGKAVVANNKSDVNIQQNLIVGVQATNTNKFGLASGGDISGTKLTIYNNTTQAITLSNNGNIEANGNIKANGSVWGKNGLYAGEKDGDNKVNKGDKYKGKIYGDGSYISNTVDSGGASPSGTKTITLGAENYTSFTIPSITVTNGRPSFSTGQINIKVSEPNSTKWATRTWVTDQKYVKQKTITKVNFPTITVKDGTKTLNVTVSDTAFNDMITSIINAFKNA